MSVSVTKELVFFLLTWSISLCFRDTLLPVQRGFTVLVAKRPSGQKEAMATHHTRDHVLPGDMADIPTAVEAWTDWGTGEEDNESGNWHPKRVRGVQSFLSPFQSLSLSLSLSFSHFSIVRRTEELEYCRVKLTGYFDHSRELLMWPRSLLSEGQHQSGSVPGAHVITPFYCYELQWVVEEEGRVQVAWMQLLFCPLFHFRSFILVNRGWVPKSRMMPTTRPNGQVCEGKNAAKFWLQN